MDNRRDLFYEMVSKIHSKVGSIRVDAIVEDVNAEKQSVIGKNLNLFRDTIDIIKREGDERQLEQVLGAYILDNTSSVANFFLEVRDILSEHNNDYEFIYGGIAISWIQNLLINYKDLENIHMLGLISNTKANSLHDRGDNAIMLKLKEYNAIPVLYAIKLNGLTKIYNEFRNSDIVKEVTSIQNKLANFFLNTSYDDFMNRITLFLNAVWRAPKVIIPKPFEKNSIRSIVIPTLPGKISENENLSNSIYNDQFRKHLDSDVEHMTLSLEDEMIKNLLEGVSNEVIATDTEVEGFLEKGLNFLKTKHLEISKFFDDNVVADLVKDVALMLFIGKALSLGKVIRINQLTNLQKAVGNSKFGLTKISKKTDKLLVNKKNISDKFLPIYNPNEVVDLKASNMSELLKTGKNFSLVPNSIKLQNGDNVNIVDKMLNFLKGIKFVDNKDVKVGSLQLLTSADIPDHDVIIKELDI